MEEYCSHSPVPGSDSRIILLVTGLLVAMLWSQEVRAQGSTTTADKSALKAFALNLVVPGLGQRYLHEGRWTGAAPLFTGADVALGLGLAGTVWYRDQQTEAYRTVAAGSAGADIEGKDRAFFVQLANYRSQERYIEHLLRTRQWTSLQAAEDPSRFWKWNSEEDWERFRAARRNADGLSRRRTILITAMVANRLVSGVTALIQARSDRSVPQAAVDVQSGSNGQLQPRLRLHFRW